jgi:hypothetical protein
MMLPHCTLLLLLLLQARVARCWWCLQRLLAR